MHADFESFESFIEEGSYVDTTTINDDKTLYSQCLARQDITKHTETQQT